ncbi:LOW QUALITY PROTEIN: hypothetical protein NC652_032032 [Populus alba x Populus x berolinensis]|nr:LOW QUALITY PROTEIN: hypothetical protein NC652_032032 [Populus alba x Populus x berolinensis]
MPPEDKLQSLAKTKKTVGPPFSLVKTDVPSLFQIGACNLGPRCLSSRKGDVEGPHYQLRGPLDLNSEALHCLNNLELFRTNKDQDKSRDVSECGSTTGPVQEKDPLRMWKEMKQNGFLSSSHGRISIQSGFMSSSHGGIPMPKQCGRKPKDDVHKKRRNLQRESRLTTIAAPSGLLNGLNPGIINHALVRSEKLENGCLESKQAIHLKSGTKETNNTRGDFNIVGTTHARKISSHTLLSAKMMYWH